LIKPRTGVNKPAEPEKNLKEKSETEEKPKGNSSPS
jgi:hypothetical protein